VLKWCLKTLGLEALGLEALGLEALGLEALGLELLQAQRYVLKPGGLSKPNQNQGV
jgi:hypothetical protein